MVCCDYVFSEVEVLTLKTAAFINGAIYPVPVVHKNVS